MKIILPPYQNMNPGDGSCLDLYLFRHGYTRYNREKRYQGSTDLPLLEEETGRIRPFSFPMESVPQNYIGNHMKIQVRKNEPDRSEDSSPEVVYVSGALRCAQTANLLFPGMRQVVIPEFREMELGVFEGRSAQEMKSDPQYISWINSMCEDPVPGGESRSQFTKRVTDRFALLASGAILQGQKRLLVVAHGGTQMAVMERFCDKDRPYWNWQSAPGEAVHALVIL